MLLSVSVYANDKDQVKAFRSFKFGDNPEVVKEKLEKDDGIIDNKFFIGDKEYEIGFEYYEDKLYRVKLVRGNLGTFETEEEAEFLAGVISKQYGEPSGRGELPDKYNESSYNVKMLYISWKYYWSKHKTNTEKIIKIEDGYSSVTAFIDDPRVLKTKYKIYKAKEKTKKMKKEEQIKDATESF